jgi:mono/diheme cytochrome c family protein
MTMMQMTTMALLLTVASVTAQSSQVPDRDASWVAPVSAAARANPLAGRPETAAGGRKIFQQRCTTCHGEDARGTDRGPNLLAADVQAQSDGALFWKISSGNTRAGMPSFSFLPEAQRWQLVLNLRSVANAGVLTRSEAAPVQLAALVHFVRGSGAGTSRRTNQRAFLSADERSGRRSRRGRAADHDSGFLPRPVRHPATRRHDLSCVADAGDPFLPVPPSACVPNNGPRICPTVHDDGASRSYRAVRLSIECRAIDEHRQCCDDEEVSRNHVRSIVQAGCRACVPQPNTTM